MAMMMIMMMCNGEDNDDDNQMIMMLVMAMMMMMWRYEHQWFLLDSVLVPQAILASEILHVHL